MDLEETQILDISLDDETEDEAEKGLLNKNLVRAFASGLLVLRMKLMR